MDAPAGTLQTLARHLVLAMEPLRSAVADLPSFRTLLYRLAWNVDSLPSEYTALGAKVDAALSALEGLGEDPPPAKIFEVLNKVKGLYVALRQISTAPAGVDPAAFLQEIGTSLFDLLLIDYLIEEFPSAHAALLALGIITQEFTEETVERPGIRRSRMRWEEIPKVLSDPGSIPTRLYGWGTDDLNFAPVAAYLLEFFVALNWPAYIGRIDEAEGRGFLDIPDDPNASIDWALKIPALMDNIGGKEVEVGLALLELPAQGGKPAGLILQPLVPPEVGTAYDITENLKLDVRAGSDVTSTFGVLLRPGGDISVKYPLQDGTSLPNAGFGVTLRYAPQSPAMLLGAPGKTRLELKGAATSFNLDFRNGQLELQLQAAPKDLKLIIASDDLDGFLGQLLGSGEKTIPITLAAQWSNRTGFNFTGGAGLKISTHPHLSLGPVRVDRLDLAIKSTFDSGHPPDLKLQVGTVLTGVIGPIAFSADGLGVTLSLVFADGNAGPFDIDYGFTLPKGLGLAIDAQGVVSGGGFLLHDPDEGQYAGVVQLSIEGGINVTGLGLIETRLPDGAKGYSLMIIIAAEDFKPIPLGLGFNLTGIGGLLALNRTFADEVLRSGLKNHTLDSVLFPRDPVRNAPQILSNLNQVFPPANGHHLFGPMARIAWGTPALITADLAVVLEFGARLRLLILAQIVAILPRRENDLLRLQMDAVGVIDFDQGTAALDATLYDSRLLKKFVLTGDMAMRMKWEGSPNFALAIGGLHPAFNPPANFPKLQRIAINLSSGDNPRIRCEAYFALTSNTVQFGARAELYASAAGFSIQGQIGFDVLIQLDPFEFLAEFHAQIQLKRGSSNLFKVKVQGALAGPRPLHLKAKATFEILWWDVSIRVDKTLVGGEKPPLPEPINVLPRLKEALGNPGNWVVQLPAGQRQMVTLRAKPGAPTDVLLHPLGMLTVKQSVVPLNIDISRFGQAVPAGPRRFTISSVSLGSNGENQTAQRVNDFFAPAQFFEMSDDEKLSRPSFEPMEAGVSFVSDAIFFTTDTSDWLEAKAIEFETLILDKGTNVAESADEENAQGVKLFYQLSPTLLGKQARFGAAGSGKLRRTGKAKYRTTIAKHRIAKEGWTIVTTDDLTVQPVAGVEAGKPASYSEAAQELRKLKQDNPAQAGRLKILRPSELARN